MNPAPLLHLIPKITKTIRDQLEHDEVPELLYKLQNAVKTLISFVVSINYSSTKSIDSVNKI